VKNKWGAPKKRETIETRKQGRGKDDAWKQQAGDWVQRMKEAMEVSWWECIQKRQAYGGPRLEPPRRVLVNVLTNRPADDGIVEEWKTMKIEVTPRYTLEEVYHKTRTRRKERWQPE
jgi:hypothetical protein